jgi:hypothetical protein
MQYKYETDGIHAIAGKWQTLTGAQAHTQIGAV